MRIAVRTTIIAVFAATGVALGAGSALADNPGSGPEWAATAPGSGPEWSVDAAQDRDTGLLGGLLG